MLWLKALHIIAVIFWSAGLLYLPRLFVHHAETADDVGRQRFCQMEKRLYWGIMLPSMLAALLFGLLLLPHYRGGWIIGKLLLVFCLLCFHVYCGVVAHRFAHGKTPHSPKFFRWFNEISPLLIAAIVLLVVLKPL